MARMLPTTLLYGILAVLVSMQSAVAYWVVQQGPLGLDARLDPIVSPGAISGHVHSFVGANNIGASATNATIRSSACTTAPVQADKSSYWTPTLYKYYNGAFQAMTLSTMNAYYLQRGNMPIQAFPPGLKMLAGSAMATGPQNTTQLQGVVSFVCLNYATGSSQTSTLPNGPCPQGLRAQLTFPSCWDGKNLDSPDHKSHLAYPLGNFADNGDACPSTHPIRFITLFYEFIWSVGSLPNNGSWVFANGDAVGYAFHGDFMNGWDTDVLQAAIDTCTGQLGGNLEGCAPFAPTLSRSTAANCKVDLSKVDGLSSEQVHGKLYSLPGCNQVSNGPNSGAGPCGATSPPAGVTYSTPARPAGYKGCYAEPDGGRALGYGAYSRSTNTVANCRAACSAKGYTIAGVEWGVECFCGNQLAPGTLSVLDTDCNMPCAGDSSQMCGDGRRLSIYSDLSSVEAATPPTNPDTIGNFKALGCYYDAVSTRTFPTRASGDNLEKCAASCSNFQYFGMEYANECYCGNTLNVAKIADSSCNMLCASNSSEYCGGPGALNVYQNPAMTTSTTTTSTSSNNDNNNNNNNTPTTSTPSAAPSLLPGTRALGCYADSSTRSLQYQAYSNNQNSPSACASACRAKGYKYSGTEYSRECFCGNYLLNAAGASNGAAKDGCTMPCTGDSSQICGGSDRLSIVQDDQYTQSMYTVTRTGRWSFSDCIVDTPSKRALPRQLSVSNNTPEKCLAACLAAKLPYCGVEYSGECFGSTTAPTAASAPSSGSSDPIARGCNMPCTGNSTVACGGSSRLNYYTYLGDSARFATTSVTA